MNPYKIICPALFLFLILSQSACVSTRVEASPYQDSVENLECRKASSWSYYWGLKQKRVDANPEVEGNGCPCREGALSWTVVKSSFTDFLLSAVTLGIVNHRTVTSWINARNQLVSIPAMTVFTNTFMENCGLDKIHGAIV